MRSLIVASVFHPMAPAIEKEFHEINCEPDEKSGD